MKIIFVANAIVGKKPGVSGGETRFLEMSRGFAKAGHDIQLLSSLGAKYLLKDFGIKAKLHIIGTNTSTGRWIFWLRLFRSIFQFPESLKTPRFDIIYASSEQSYDVISALRLKLRNPDSIIAVAVHWLPPTPPWKRTGSTFFNSLFFWLSERIGLYLAMFFADILLPVSETTADQLRTAHIPERKFRVVECGVDFGGIQRFAKRAKLKYDAVFMKRIQKSKGIFDLIEAWQIVVSKLPRAQLIVIGEGIDRVPAEMMVKKLRLEKHIRFLGVIYDFKEKFSTIASSKLFVLPTHEENWAIVIGEAMAAGAPVVAYGLPELKAVWADACEWVTPLDTKSFARAMVRLLTNEQERLLLKGRALAYVQRYDWAAIAKKELGLIESLRKSK